MKRKEYNCHEDNEVLNKKTVTREAKRKDSIRKIAISVSLTVRSGRERRHMQSSETFIERIQLCKDITSCYPVHHSRIFIVLSKFPFSKSHPQKP